MNILLLFSDQHNASFLGASGNQIVKTPHLDSLAREGAMFERMYCQNGICMPSRTSMFTGRHIREIETWDNGQDSGPALASATPLQSLLKRRGYATGAFGKRHLHPTVDVDFDCLAGVLKNEGGSPNYVDWIDEHGLLDTFLRDWNAEFGRENSSEMAFRISELPEDMTMEAFTARYAKEFISDCASKKTPFFAWASFYRPHQPYTVRTYTRIRCAYPLSSGIREAKQESGSIHSRSLWISTRRYRNGQG